MNRRLRHSSRTLALRAGRPNLPWSGLEALEGRLALSVDLSAAGGPLAAGGMYAPGQQFQIAVGTQNAGNEAVSEQRREVRFVLNSGEWNSATSVVVDVMDFAVEANFVGGFFTNITVPTNTPSGTYYVAQMADAAGQVAETDENNNIAWSDFTIEVVSGGNSDVTFGFEFFTAPVQASGGSGPYRWGDSLNLSGGLWVDGTGAINQSLSLTAIIDQDEIFGNSDDAASWTGTISSFNLSPGSETSLQSGTLTIPEGTPDGVYSAYFFVNGSFAWNEIGFPSVELGNNKGVVSGGIIVANEDADLIASISNVSPAPASPGQGISIDFQVTNEYQYRTAGASTARFVLTNDDVLGNEDDITIGDQAVPDLPGGASFGGTYFATMPATIGLGEWRVALIADVNGEFSEEDEENNTATFATIMVNNPGPDLFVDDIQPSTPQTITAGESYPIGWVLVNSGDASVGASWLEVFISSDTTAGNGDDITVGRFRASAIAAGSAFVGTGAAFFSAIPAGTAPGSYFIGFRADADDEHEETNESNNILLATDAPLLTVEAAANLEPDLVAVFDGMTPSNPQPGETFTVSFTIQNLGQTQAGASTTQFFIPAANGSQFDFFLGVADTPVIAGGASFSGTKTLTVSPDLLQGQWTLAIVADIDGVVTEGDESNNALITPTVIIFPASLGAQVGMRGGGGLNQIILYQTKASRAKGTGFGPVERDGASKQIVFLIVNSGQSTLTITSIEPRGQRPEDYSIVVMPTLTLAPGATTTFTLEFDPTAYGTRRANVAIFSNDLAHSGRFNMRVAGRGVPDPALQDVAVTGGSVTISDGDRKARNGTGQKFGSVGVGQQIVKIFTISNEGNSILTFASPVIRVAGANPGDFSVVAFPTHATLAPGETTTFSIRFLPGVAGLRRATIEVLTNDPDEGTFDFKVIGTGI